MAKASLPVLPFPDHLDRRRFGDWLSGFTDGEGCFGLYLHTYNYSRCLRPVANYSISIRADDLPVLRLIQSFFDCGCVVPGTRDNGKSKDSYVFKITSLDDLMTVAIPHFQTHPLLAKKARDFHIWCEGVRFIHSVANSRRLLSGGRVRAGQPQHWTADRVSHFLAIRDRLRKQREFQAPDLPPPPRPSFPDDPSLFDERA
jgi:hypothetical protein